MTIVMSARLAPAELRAIADQNDGTTQTASASRLSPTNATEVLVVIFDNFQDYSLKDRWRQNKRISAISAGTNIIAGTWTLELERTNTSFS